MPVPLRQCPECGVSVKVETLRRHVTKVHPGNSAASASFVDRETRALRQPVRRPRRSPSSWRWVAAIGLVLALTAGLVAAWPRVAGPTSGSPDGATGGEVSNHPGLPIPIKGKAHP